MVTNLARRWCDQDKMDEARDLLTSVYGWSNEGFGMPDLMDAKALADKLS